MGTCSPALERAHFLLHQDLYRYIDAVEELSRECNVSDEAVLFIAREHIPRLIGAIRGAIGKHRADVFGHCLGCPPSWSDGRYIRETWPCQVVDEMYRHMQEAEVVYESVNDVDSSNNH